MEKDCDDGWRTFSIKILVDTIHKCTYYYNSDLYPWEFNAHAFLLTQGLGNGGGHIKDGHEFLSRCRRRASS